MENKEYLDKLRHSAAHLLAAAVMELYPNAKRTIGPAIENGFYFDFDFGDVKVSEEDLPKIEQKMHELLPSFTGFEKHMLNSKDAMEEYPDNSYKHELIDEFSEHGKKEISFYESVGLKSKSSKKIENYWDLCRGGHVENPNEELKHFKLLSIAGAYWRGNEKNPMLTRIYGTVFPTQNELDDYLNQLEEAKKRDHRRLAKDLDLIVFSELVGGGLPLWTPKGHILRNAVYSFSRTLNSKIGYKETTLPNMNRGELFKVSGHYDKYHEDMFLVKSHYTEEEFFLKPMNCPQHCVLFGSQTRSYRDLPIRYAAFSMLYRDEKPGEISGLFRTRSFAQDDGHCFCTEEQIEQEFQNVLEVIEVALNTYGFENYWVRISLRDPENKDKYLGEDGVWQRAEQKLIEIAEKTGLKSEKALGEAAIYGPKIDFMAKDALNREWQVSTVQLDMIMPERFGLKYVDENGELKTPFMVHRAIVGSERFIAILIEHFVGAFPVWLSPVQVKILPITDRNLDFAKSVGEQLSENGIRLEIDERSETLGSKIRDAQNEKVPYMLIVGDKEQEANKVSVRLRSEEDLGQMDIGEFVKRVNEKIERKSLEL